MHFARLSRVLVVSSNTTGIRSGLRFDSPRGAHPVIWTSRKTRRSLLRIAETA